MVTSSVMIVEEVTVLTELVKTKVEEEYTSTILNDDAVGCMYVCMYVCMY